MKKGKVFVVCLFLALTMVSYPQNVSAANNNLVVHTQEKGAKVKLSKNKATIKVGKTLKLKVSGTSKTVYWSSSDNKVAVVDSEGKVKGKSAGTAIITAVVGDKELVCNVTVKNEKKSYDYKSATELEEALNSGKDCTGQTVKFKVDKVVPDSAFGYNLWAGEHLNFCSIENPHASKGETVAVKITTVENVLGSWIIYYEKIK